MATLTISNDFVHSSLVFVSVNLFLQKNVWNFVNWKRNILQFWHQKVLPLEKIRKIKKNVFFIPKSHIFQLESDFYLFSLFFRYIVYDLLKISKFSFF